MFVSFSSVTGWQSRVGSIEQFQSNDLLNCILVCTQNSANRFDLPVQTNTINRSQKIGASGKAILDMNFGRVIIAGALSNRMLCLCFSYQASIVLYCIYCRSYFQERGFFFVFDSSIVCFSYFFTAVSMKNSYISHI